MAGIPVLAVLLFPAGPGPVESGDSPDLIVAGCNVLTPGQVGIRELVGDIGDTVGVPVTVHTDSPLESFTLYVDFPTTLLRYAGVGVGNLTPSWWIDGTYLEPRQQARVVGITPAAPVPDGAVGQLAILRFVVLGGGTGVFRVPESDYGDDLAGYTSCDSSWTSPLEPAGWGRIKSAFR
jgi:hypothetical protein